MALSPTQKSDIDAILQLILDATPSRGKRHIAGIFLELVDKEAYPEYYKVIPEPRSLNGVKQDLEKGNYQEPLDVYQDINLVFLNAMHYNEAGSQIAKDAKALKTLLDHEWNQRPSLPTPQTSPPPSSPQKQNPSASATATSNPQTPQLKMRTLVPRPVEPSTPRRRTTPLPSGGTPKRGETKLPLAAIQTLPTIPASPDRQGSPDMDVDVGGTPEPENMVTHDTARDADSDEIVKQLEKGLPRWEGLGEEGWAQELTLERCEEIFKLIVDHKDASGNRPAASLEALPQESTIPELSFSFPLSLSMIEIKLRDKEFASPQEFDKLMAQLFLKGRRSYELGTESYGNVLLLQRLYQALTSSTPPEGPPFQSDVHFASLRAGPGTTRPLHSTDTEGVPGVTTFRVSIKDRSIADDLNYKGLNVRLADWIHLSNPDDPSRPIIAQVFKCWVSDEPSKKGKPGVTVCWYFRPEQTWHPAQRQFWDREIFKTSHFADHALEDLIEKVSCQFTARHIRGRPRPPFWYPGWPLYVCDSRYNDRDRAFVKIKNWNSCVPEEVRKSTEFMPIYPFERTVFPKRFASPFSSATPPKAPGGIVAEVVEKLEAEKPESSGAGRRTRSRKANESASKSKNDQTDKLGQSKGVFVGHGATSGPSIITAHPTQQAIAQTRASSSDRSIMAAVGVAGGNVSMERLPPETAKYFDRDPETNEVLWFAAPPIDIPHARGPKYSLTYLHFLAEKRKRSQAEGDMIVDEDVSQPPTKKLANHGKSMTETFNELWREHGMDKLIP